ncbi:MAG: ATP-dependent DNA helicase RecG [Lachnospiraceae bacterium]|nr:ATP-dependent DNA helicase RecG [Lachnospiraceae bacterium]
MFFNDDITKLKGVGGKTKELFSRLLIFKIKDLLEFFPRDYFTYPDPVKSVKDLTEGQIAVFGRIKSSLSVKRTRSMDITLGSLTLPDSDKIELIWYRMPYIKNQIILGSDYVLYGNLKKDGSKFKLEQAKLFTPKAYGSLCEKLLPVYPLTKGLTGDKLRKFVQNAFDETIDISEFLPRDWLKERNLTEYREALFHYHFPDSFEDLYNSRIRLAYNEFLFFALNMKMELKAEEKAENDLVLDKHDIYDRVRSSLPFSLTKGQAEALSDIEKDFGGEYIAQRLIQGDVGSGKTVIAFLSMVYMAENGYQSAIMAPTEVLAAQHFESFSKMSEDHSLPFCAVLLTGSMTAKEKRIAREKISSHEADFIIGTHAVFQEKVEFNNLGLVITDEQHRFGVRQRKALAEKGHHVFSIVMSATPIPRTLAMILYTGMNISVISELPSNRLPIKNSLVGSDKRMAAYGFILKQLKEGRQGMIICPMVESGDDSNDNAPENVVDYTEKIKPYFKDFSIAKLHGRMKADEKERIMADFASGKIDLLVSTTVIEVGINVPNATVIMIENANRFGLAQLHQLRGRVGRGAHQSYCIFIDTSGKKEVSERLKVLSESNDGFKISSFDLQSRGPGDIMGIRQSGDFAFKVADIYQDSKLLNNVSADCDLILEEDPDLSSDKYHLLKLQLQSRLSSSYTNL